MTHDLLDTNPDVLLQKKLAGYTVQRFLDAKEGCSWYEGQADNGEQVLLYVYTDRLKRQDARVGIHGFRTADDVTVSIEGADHALFVTVGDHRIMMPRSLRNSLVSEDTRPGEVGGYEILRVLGEGYKGVTYEVKRRDGPGTPYALKLTIAEEYEGRTPLGEIDRMVQAAADDRDHFPQIHECKEYKHSCDGTESDLVYFVEDLIKGTTLKRFLLKSGNDINADFLLCYVNEMLAALSVLEACNLMHDDLHAGNVMLHEPVVGKRRPYIIDFGSAKTRGQTKKQRDDLRNLATHVADMTNRIQQAALPRTAHEDRILASCEALLAKISDDDPMRQPESAREVLDHWERSFSQGAVRQKLVHPFDFGNAEEVLDNQLLYELSAKSFPWRDKIEASSHLLVIGPRGCGKTTVFRSMSLRCLADAGRIDEALSRPFVGLYISCNREFRLRFSALDRDLLRRREDDLRHYLNLIVLREFTASLIACQKQLTEMDLGAFRTFVRQHTGLLSEGADGNRASLDEIEATITRAIYQTRMRIWNDQDCPTPTTQGFVADLADFAATKIGPFGGKVLYLFVDDYTERKVPKEAQQALNHILFVPNSSYKCKISSEVFGVTPDQTFGGFLDQDRDYREWNLGTLYCLNLPSKSQKEFLGEIVDNRLELCEYEGRVQSLLGESQYKEGTLARTLKKEAEQRHQKRQEKLQAKPPEVAAEETQRELEDERILAYYHGWDTICDLCIGDVSNILELLNRMFDQCNVTRDQTSLIPPGHQNVVIEGYSKQYLSKVKGIPRHGERLFKIIDAFGHLSRRLLEEYPYIERKGNRRDPYQLLRIELDEAGLDAVATDLARFEEDDGHADATDLPPLLWKLLQRYCLFIDADKGRSRRNTLSSVVLLRRIFCPAFRIGLVNSESFTLSQQQWSAFCADSKGIAENHARSTIEDARKKRGDEKYPLFD